MGRRARSTTCSDRATLQTTRCCVLGLTGGTRSRYRSGLAHRCQEPGSTVRTHPNLRPEQEPSISERRDSKMADRTTRGRGPRSYAGTTKRHLSESSKSGAEPGEPGAKPG